MTKYQLVPYLVRVHVRGLPSETRPLDSLDADGLDLADELGGLLSAHVGKTVQQTGSLSPRPHRVRIDSVGKGTRSLNFVIAPGQSGIASKIARPDGTSVERRFSDTEHVPLRHYFVYGAGRHEGVLLAERVAGKGAITALRTFVTQAWTARYEALTLTIAPAGDEKLWDSVLADRPVLKYQMTRSTAEGKLAISGKPAQFSLDVKPPGRGERWSLRTARQRARDRHRPLRSVLLEEVSPVLAPGYSDPEDGAAALIDDGWSVAVQLELESGQRPVVNVESDTSVTLTFPLIENAEEPDFLPDVGHVLEAVKRLVSTGVFERNGMRRESALNLEWVTDPCNYQGGAWKVGWTVVDQHEEATPTD